MRVIINIFFKKLLHTRFILIGRIENRPFSGLKLSSISKWLGVGYHWLSLLLAFELYSFVREHHQLSTRHVEANCLLGVYWETECQFFKFLEEICNVVRRAATDLSYRLYVHLSWIKIKIAFAVQILHVENRAIGWIMDTCVLLVSFEKLAEVERVD